MFEIGIISLIVLAVSYWAVLWVMGRREDVLHGEFVEGKAKPGEPVRATSPEPLVRPIFPESPASSERPKFPERTAFPTRSALPEWPLLPEPLLRERPARATVPEQPAFQPERLQQLLASIKQDLNQLVQK
ncbi:hypothetical protein [Afipia sp. GAS231]|uniref:hypothetical protein n=1 Tax=Afipia sp. GAS231 TaxID=1882747 RepID=UPI00087C34E1|nr:hypothetical protein [Afipia sp. GAS231]SDN18391.1 hypothetical protein SAMN05444050_0918 [Afipia sp. GAS231]